MTISVLIADDQAMIREGLRLILETEPDLEVVAEAGDGAEALALVRELRPDVVVLDIRMPRIDGLSVAQRLMADPDWSGSVLMLTTFADDEYLYQALRSGVSGYLLKTSPPRLLPTAIREAHAGETMLSADVTRRLIERFTSQSPAGPGVPPSLASLTAREVDVLRLLARGRSNAEIALDLFLAESTVKTHVVHILEKLGLRDRTQAAVAAYEAGLIRPGAGGTGSSD